MLKILFFKNQSEPDTDEEEPNIGQRDIAFLVS
jgi:hypothetical protein